MPLGSPQVRHRCKDRFVWLIGIIVAHEKRASLQLRLALCVLVLADWLIAAARYALDLSGVT